MDNEVREVLQAARSWAKAREKCRRVSDSKSAKPGDLDRAKKTLMRCSDKLARAVATLETMLRKKPRVRKNGTDWHSVLGAVSVVAQAVESSIRPRPPFGLGVIDTTAEEV